MEIEELEYAPEFIMPKEKRITNIKCVYGIFIRDRLVYIGYTWTGFDERVKKHIEAIKNKNIGDKISKEMYEALRQCEEDYSFKVLYKCPE